MYVCAVNRLIRLIKCYSARFGKVICCFAYFSGGPDQDLGPFIAAAAVTVYMA